MKLKVPKAWAMISFFTITLFLTTFVNAQENQLLTRYSPDNEQTAAVQQIIIDGQKITDRRAKPRKGQIKKYPTLRDITQILEHKIWSL